MSLEGMDVDQVQQLAQCLSENAQTLSRINAMLATLSAELGHYWQGPSSAAFQQQWAAQYRPALSNAAAALSDLHAHVIANLEQQVQASAAGTGAGSAGLAGPAAPASGLTLGGILGALGGGIAGTWGIASKIEGYVSLATTPFERLEQLSDESTLLRFEDSPILNWLNDNPHVQELDELMSKAGLADVLDKVDKVGTAMSYLAIGTAAAASVHDLADHQYGNAFGQVIDGTAAGLKNSKDPVAYLAGFDLSLLQKDYELGRQIQWSGIPSPFSVSNFENDYIPAFESLPGQLVSTLSEVI